METAAFPIWGLSLEAISGRIKQHGSSEEAAVELNRTRRGHGEMVRRAAFSPFHANGVAVCQYRRAVDTGSVHCTRLQGLGGRVEGYLRRAKLPLRWSPSRIAELPLARAASPKRGRASINLTQPCWLACSDGLVYISDSTGRVGLNGAEFLLGLLGPSQPPISDLGHR